MGSSALEGSHEEVGGVVLLSGDLSDASFDLGGDASFGAFAREDEGDGAHRDAGDARDITKRRTAVAVTVTVAGNGTVGVTAAVRS